MYCRDGALSVFRQPSEHANGNFIEPATGDMLTCHTSSRVVTATNLATGERRTLADTEEFLGKPLTSPNDVVVSHRDGSIWFTDPDYGALMPALGHGKPGEQAGNYVYRLDPKTGAMWPVATDFVSNRNLDLPAPTHEAWIA